MIASELKYRWAAKSLARLGKEASVSSGNAKGKKFAVVLDSEDRVFWEKFQALQTEFKLAAENFTLLCLRDIKEEDAGVVPLIPTDLGWGGKLKNERATDFFRNAYDVLIVFTSESAPLSEMVVRASRADLKIGREEDSADLYDLSIQTRFEEVDLFLVEVKRYLKVLKY